MLIREIINEMTSAGAVATVAMPMTKKPIKRPGVGAKKKDAKINIGKGIYEDQTTEYLKKLARNFKVGDDIKLYTAGGGRNKFKIDAIDPKGVMIVSSNSGKQYDVNFDPEAVTFNVKDPNYQMQGQGTGIPQGTKVKDVDPKIVDFVINKIKPKILQKNAGTYMALLGDYHALKFHHQNESISEGEERSIIRDAAVDYLVDMFGGNNWEQYADTKEEAEEKVYSELEILSVDEVVDPNMEVGGQRIGNFASGRVIDVVSSGEVMDDVMSQMTFNEGKSPHKKGTKKYKKHMAAMHAG